MTIELENHAENAPYAQARACLTQAGDFRRIECQNDIETLGRVHPLYCEFRGNEQVIARKPARACLHVLDDCIDVAVDLLHAIRMDRFELCADNAQYF